MLRRFFRGRDRLSDPDPQIRREAIRELDPERARERSAELAALVADDPDRTVRLAAIERLDAMEALARVLDDDAVGDAAARRLQTLGARGGVALPDHPRLRALTLLQANPDERRSRITGIGEPEQLVQLALKDRGAIRAEVLAHPAMRTGAGLALLEKRSRGTDKALNRHARDALDRLRRLQQQATAALQRAEELVQALHRTAHTGDRTAWEREVLLHNQCAQALASYDTARAALASTFGETLPSREALGTRVTPPELRPEPVRVPPPELPRTESHADASIDSAGEAELPASGAATLRVAKQAAAELAAAHAAAAAKASAAMSAERPDAERPDAEHPNAASADAGPGNLPAAVGETPEPGAEQAATVPRPADDAPTRAAASAARHAALQELDKLLDALEENVTAGHVAPSRQLLADVRHRVDALGHDAPRGLRRRLNRLGGAFAELRDWQDYATAPKREALCDAVQALVEHPRAPPDQADRLKALRVAWRELGPVARAADARLAERFNVLAEQAFEPCRAYFAEQAELRRSNLAERERICAQLADYLGTTDWQRADMKAADRILRTARETWRQFVPVDRGPGKAQDARFEALQQDLFGRIRAWWDGNAEAKQRIVKDAEALVADDGPIDARIERVKGLQQDWREIGPAMPRSHDQALWTSFRTACDALFSARETARHAADADIRKLAGQCAAALDAFAAELDALAPGAVSEAQARALRDRLRSLDGLPPALRHPLADRRAALLARHQTLLRNRERAIRQARLGELQQRDREVSAAEIAHRDRGPAPVAPEPCFAARIGSAHAPVPEDALRRMTLRAEQAAGIAPPAEDEPLRLEVQVERLRAGLAGAAGEPPLQLAERWCTIGPKDASIEPLRIRFFAALAALAALPGD
jgi:exonuclease SbcC